MTNPDYRALCAELVDAWQKGDDIVGAMNRARAALAEPESIQAQIAKADAAIEASMERIRSLAAPARAALAKREHIFPTPSQAAECGGPCYEGNYCPEACDCGLYRPPALLAEPEAVGPTDDEIDDFIALWWEHYGQGYLPYSSDKPLVKAALARWGRPAAAPVPVSERLPGPEDCDAEGRCWLGGHLLANGTPTWLLGYPAWDARFQDVHHFWLPANALPGPAPEGGEAQP